MSAIDNIKHKEEHETFYKKVGKRYVKINDPFWIEGLRKGFHLVQIKNDGSSIRSIVYPDRAELYAAQNIMENKILEVLSEATKARVPYKLSEEESKDWDKLNRKHPGLFQYISFDSLADMSKNVAKGLSDLKNDY